MDCIDLLFDDDEREQPQEPTPNQPAPAPNQPEPTPNQPAPTPNRPDAAAPQNQERQQKDDKENRAPKPPSLPKNYRIPKFKSGDDRLVSRARRRAMQANKHGKGVAAGRPPLLVSAMQALGEAMDASVAQAVLRPDYVAPERIKQLDRVRDQNEFRSRRRRAAWEQSVSTAPPLPKDDIQIGPSMKELRNAGRGREVHAMIHATRWDQGPLQRRPDIANTDQNAKLPASDRPTTPPQSSSQRKRRRETSRGPHDRNPSKTGKRSPRRQRSPRRNHQSPSGSRAQQQTNPQSHSRNSYRSRPEDSKQRRHRSPRRQRHNSPQIRLLPERTGEPPPNNNSPRRAEPPPDNTPQPTHHSEPASHRRPRPCSLVANRLLARSIESRPARETGLPSFGWSRDDLGNPISETHRARTPADDEADDILVISEPPPSPKLQTPPPISEPSKLLQKPPSQLPVRVKRRIPQIPTVLDGLPGRDPRMERRQNRAELTIPSFGVVTVSRHELAPTLLVSLLDSESIAETPFVPVSSSSSSSSPKTPLVPETNSPSSILLPPPPMPPIFRDPEPAPPQWKLTDACTGSLHEGCVGLTVSQLLEKVTEIGDNLCCLPSREEKVPSLLHAIIIAGSQNARTPWIDVADQVLHLPQPTSISLYEWWRSTQKTHDEMPRPAWTRKVLTAVGTIWRDSCLIANSEFNKMPGKLLQVPSEEPAWAETAVQLADAVSAMRSRTYFPGNAIANTALVFLGNAEVREWARQYRSAFALVTTFWEPPKLSFSHKTRTIVVRLDEDASTACVPIFRYLRETGIAVIVTMVPPVERSSALEAMCCRYGWSLVQHNDLAAVLEGKAHARR